MLCAQAFTEAGRCVGRAGPSQPSSAAYPPAARKGTSPSYQPSWHDRGICSCQEKRGRGKWGSSCWGQSFSPLEEPRPGLQSLARSQGSKEAVRSIRRRKTSRGYSEDSRAGEAGWTEGEEELPGWLAPASSPQGLTAPWWAGAPSSDKAEARRKSPSWGSPRRGSRAGLRAPWSQGWGTTPLGDPEGTW